MMKAAFVLFVLVVSVTALIATVRAPTVFGQICAAVATVCFVAVLGALGSNDK